MKGGVLCERLRAVYAPGGVSVGVRVALSGVCGMLMLVGGSSASASVERMRDTMPGAGPAPPVLGLPVWITTQDSFQHETQIRGFVSPTKCYAELRQLNAPLLGVPVHARRACTH